MESLHWSGGEPRAGVALAIGSVVLAFAGSATAQVTYSIDYTGPTIALPNSRSGSPITEADVLVAPVQPPGLGPALMRPGILINGGPLGGLGLMLYPGCVGHPPGFPCGIEVDALSYGTDAPAVPAPDMPGIWWFSVDEFAIGLPVGPMGPPDVVSEGMTAAMEASADMFVNAGMMPPGPLPPFAAPMGNRMAIDGNGFRGRSPDAAPGLGLIEWNPPAPIPALGDDVDALDMDLPPIVAPSVYFSLDGPFVDPLTGRPNSASALRHGFVGGDVIRVVPMMGGPALYAPAVVLGLDRFMGPDSDDLDALVLVENGIAGYQPSASPFDWLGGATDMLLFSVRRGSAVIGLPDSIFGAPIQEGDVLTTPFVNGVSPFPGIFVAAENFGLATRRAGAAFGDEIDGLDRVALPVFDCDGNGSEDVADILSGLAPDCNRNGIPDLCDLQFGASYDGNGNGVPDECEFSGVVNYCVAKINSLGCSPLIGAFGTPSATNALPYWVSAVDIVSARNGTLFYGFGPLAAPFQGGTKCVANPVRRTPIQGSGGVSPPSTCTGVFRYDMNARIQGGVDPFLLVGATVYAQYWYRDPGVSFGTGLSDAIRFTIAP